MSVLRYRYEVHYTHPSVGTRVESFTEPVLLDTVSMFNRARRLERVSVSGARIVEVKVFIVKETNMSTIRPRPVRRV